MSRPRPTLSELEAAYEHSLEKQIVGQGTNLACRDQELQDLVEGLLKEGMTGESKCLGLDSLRVMEESLTRAVAVPTARSRGGLQGLAKAFEVLEQAALNLYLSPWREEYKIVKVGRKLWAHMWSKCLFSFPQKRRHILIYQE